ncbi:MAG: bifunctional phosphopantothenoylcysteine decarboxylase/phosphopantothenate--cysteine ligase CoaBC [Candidatus Coprenecus sp.]|nr:bifunctional phosphopantothenoylcysteine decarboxylase/phosphopantothenate--cysteine ligase CoaBC [Candidatus Coprenecus sp.]
MLNGKHILVGITGSIAAYKTAMLVRHLVKEGADVQVIMTEKAKEFITPLTMATLSRHPILVDFFNPENGQWNSHVSLGLWADLYIVAPASANTLAKMAYGIADNLLLTTYLSARCPVMVAPAMDLDMFKHPATMSSLGILRERGVHVIEPSSGELASGLEGKGRMEEPENIIRYINDFFASNEELCGMRVLITSGPTREAIDPVRFITNCSSGKMASEIARHCRLRGADVTVVSGPAAVKPLGVTLIEVESAQQMATATLQEYEKGVDIVVLCAAVADYTPVAVSDTKIKKKTETMTIELRPTTDIAAAVGARKREGDILVGFALETDNEFSNAVDKLRRKNLDMIVLNSLRNEGAGFAVDTNQVEIIFRDGTAKAYPLKSKSDVASDIVDNIVKLTK